MITRQIRSALLQHATPDAKSIFVTRFLGVPTPVTRNISKAYFEQVRHLPKTELFAICEELMKDKFIEEIVIASDWAFRYRKFFTTSDFAIFESWVSNYVEEWASCDEICSHPLGFFLYTFPEHVAKVKSWAISDNQWRRRAAAVSLIYSVRKKKYIPEALEVAALLLKDREHLVNKGCGWLLKEVGRHFPREAYTFLKEKKPLLDKTLFRYALEKLPGMMQQELRNM